VSVAPPGVILPWSTVCKASMQRNQRGALTQFDGGEPITVRAARYVGDILKYVPDDQAIAPRYSFHM
jgi:hypothetical protein